MIDIRDLESLCDFINENEDWQTATEEIIERNGWENLCGTTWGIARDGDYVAELNDDAEAEVYYRPQTKKTYIVRWDGPSNSDHELTAATVGHDFVYAKEFSTLKEAEKFFKKELCSANDMKPFAELDFAPTEEECRSHEKLLCLFEVITDEDGDSEEEMVKTSDSYWID